VDVLGPFGAEHADRGIVRFARVRGYEVDDLRDSAAAD
jgi:hypothetical protein